jgi:hypothetical protein
VVANPRLERENVAGHRAPVGRDKISWRSQTFLVYTCGTPVQQGFAGLGAHAWRNAETQEKTTKREFLSPALTQL